MAKKVAKKTTRAPGERPAAKAADAGPMSLPRLEQLVRLMSENDMTFLELRDGEQRITLNRGGPQQSLAPQPAVAAPSPAPRQMPSDPAATAAPPAEAPAAASNLTEIKSPMVGTFYNSPTPEAPAFVSVGSKVGPDTDVCIIEAMKVFNNIKAEASGTVEKVLVESGSAVEYGQVLFLIKP